MITLSTTCRYFLYHEPVNILSSFYKLSAIVAEQMQQDPMTGDVFIFLNRKCTQIKLLQWQQDGYCICYKKLEEGTFEMPSAIDKQYLLTSTQLMLILQGIRLDKIQYRKRYNHQFSDHSSQR